MGPDWSLLPSELLQIISKNMTFIGDYICFRAVCSPWRSALSPRPLHIPVQAPWLMRPYQCKGNDDSTHRFYDLFTSKIHRPDLPETNDVEICGSSHGWLVLHDGKKTSLLNPITRTTITLPPYTGPLSPLGIAPLDALDEGEFFENWDPDSYTIKPTDNFSVEKAILTSSPLNPDSLVFVLMRGLWCLAFCKIGDEKWRVVEFWNDLSGEWDILDFTYSDGFLYTVNPFGYVTIYDLNCPLRRVMLGHCISLNKKYLVEGVSGDILLIDYSGWECENGFPVKEIRHTVYKLSSNEEPDWIEVTDLGRNMLFCGDGHAISLSSDNLQLSKQGANSNWQPLPIFRKKQGANCLFYDSIMCEWHPDKLSPSYNHNIKLDRLDDRTVTVITGNLGLFQKTTHWQRSFWFIPSFR